MKILITGGCGFIGTNLIKHMVNTHPNYQIFNLDSLTYASTKNTITANNYTFVQMDIRDRNLVMDLFKEHKFDRVIHLAAESHVDRSIHNPLIFAETNIIGTINLLDALLESCDQNRINDVLFYFISTDEVYGSLEEGYFTEDSNYDPNSPYSASKAAADHFVKAYGTTYGLPYIISHCSNNYGKYQHPEKLIPMCIRNILQGKPLPIYGDGCNVRDWLYVQDHVQAIDLILHSGSPMSCYNIGGSNEWTNINLVKLLCSIMNHTCDNIEFSEQMITFVKDRPGHDKRYAIDSSKLQQELGWKPTVTFEMGLKQTVDWYLENTTFLLQ